MFGRSYSQCSAEREVAVEIALHAILLSDNGEKLLDSMCFWSQIILNYKGEQYDLSDVEKVRDAILWKIQDKTWIEKREEFFSKIKKKGGIERSYLEEMVGSSVK